MTLDDHGASRTTAVGLISDTHGLLRPEVLETFAGVDVIIHAGDVGREGILEALRAVAPTHAVRGNVAKGAWAEPLPRDALIEVDEVSIYVYHGHEELNLEPRAAGCRVVISGHSHQPEVSEKGGVLYLNPGSAGPRRFKLPVSVMRLHLKGGEVQPELVQLV